MFATERREAQNSTISDAAIAKIRATHEAPRFPVTKPAGCTETTDGTHYVEWVTRPAMTHNGQQVSSEERRGICAFCGEIRVEQAG